MEERKPQKLDTLAKQGKYWRITEIEGDTITARRISGADYKPRQGKALVDTWENLVKKGYRLCDIAPVTVIKEGMKPAEEQPATEPKTAPLDIEEAKQVWRDTQTVLATQTILAAEEAEQLAEDSRRLGHKSNMFRVRLTTGREHTVRMANVITAHDAGCQMMVQRFYGDENGIVFATELIETITAIVG